MRDRLLTTTSTITSKQKVIFYFSLSLTFAAIYAGLALKQAFSNQYVVQDDAREYVIWMQRFSNPDLLRGDLITDYFQSVTPWGYARLYQLMAAVGISPLLLSKLLPMVVGLLTTGYCFYLCLQLLPIPMAGFISTLLLNQSIWLKDDLVSATPRGFLYPLLLALLYYLLQKSWWSVCTITLLLGAFYPPGVLLAAGVLFLQLMIDQVQRWIQAPDLSCGEKEKFQKFQSPAFIRGVNPKSKIQNPKSHDALSRRGKILPALPTLTKEGLSRRDYLFCLTGVGLAFLVMLSYALTQSKFGPIVTAAEARTWPEFFPGGRMPFFDDANPLAFWFSGVHSSIGLDLNPPAIASGFFLPLLMRYPSHFPLVKQLTKGVIVLPQLLLVSLCWFFAAHALLLKLFFPSRYMMHSLRMVLCIAAAIALSVLWDAAWQKIGKLDLSRFWGRKLLAVGATLLVGAVVVFYPNIFWKRHFPETLYVDGGMPVLYEFFQKQPKDSLTASLAEEANNLPIFAQRPILVGREYSIPYHVGYYRQVRDRATDLIRAQYSPDLAEVKRFIQKYKVSFWLLEQSAFTPQYLESDRWLLQYQPAVSEAVANLKQGTIPALAQVSDRCSVLQTGSLVVIQAQCIVTYEP